jgi:hypothetical protein
MGKFIISEQEKHSILGMHKKHGYNNSLINEEDTKNFCLKKYGDTSKPQYQSCMFTDINTKNFDNVLSSQVLQKNRIYEKNPSVRYFKDSSGKNVYTIKTKILDIGGIPKFMDESVIIQILDYMVANKYIESYDKSSLGIGKKLFDLPAKNSKIAKKGSKGETIVSLPDPPKDASGVSPITNFTYWPNAYVYYYDPKTPTNYVFTDDGTTDPTFLDLIQNRI